MSKKLAGIVIAVTLVAVAVLALATILARQPEPQTPATGHQQTQAEADQSPTDAPAAPGVYTEYSTEAVAAASGTKVLFFHAPWCPQCRELDKSIKEGSIPAGVTIFKVDYDSNQTLRQKYGVTIQTTLVKIDDSGALVKKYVAYNKPDLQALIENVL